MNCGYKLPDKIVNELGHFDNIVTNHNPSNSFNGRVLVHCMRKADHELADLITEHKSGLLVVNCRTETIQFQKLLETAHSVMLLKGRLRFKDAKYNEIIPSNAPYGTAIFSFCEEDTLILKDANLKGQVLILKAIIQDFA